jgi:hypothetical protein
MVAVGSGAYPMRFLFPSQYEAEPEQSCLD